MKRLWTHRRDVPNRTYFVLTLVATAVLSVLVWEALRPSVSEAQNAGRPGNVPFALDTTKQNQDILTAQQETNKKLDTLIALFKSGEARVRIASGTKPPAPDSKK